MERFNLTCWSCHHWQRDGCAKGVAGFPSVRLRDCQHASYEPGADQSEMTAQEAP
jgi:hypothetical protein